jgi:hypothetical protein
MSQNHAKARTEQKIIMLNKNSDWARAALALVLAAGCAHEQAQPQPSAQTSVPQQSLSPTSDRQDPRVYAESPAGIPDRQDPGIYSELPATSTDNQTPKGGYVVCQRECFENIFP